MKMFADFVVCERRLGVDCAQFQRQQAFILSREPMRDKQFVIHIGIFDARPPFAGRYWSFDCLQCRQV